MKTKVETIWLENEKELKRFVLSKIKDKDISKDILQDVFLKLHSKIHTLKSDNKIKPWLYQITRNTITDHFRQFFFTDNKAIPEIPSEIVPETGNEEFVNCMQPHINRLPQKYKEALTKTEFENYSQLQLANELKISYSTAKSRVQRAKSLLKKYFQECCNISSDKYGNIIGYHAKQNCKLCDSKEVFTL